MENPRLSDKEAVWRFAKDHERLNMEQTVRFGDAFKSLEHSYDAVAGTHHREHDAMDLWTSSALATANLGEYII